MRQQDLGISVPWALDGPPGPRPPTGKIHLARLPTPLRIDRLTECGLVLSADRRWIEWSTWIVNGVEQPGVRPSLCAVCAGNLRRHEMRPHHEWDRDPVDALNRGVRTSDKRRRQAQVDLWAMAILVEKHPDEFEVIRHVVEQRKKMVR